MNVNDLNKSAILGHAFRTYPGGTHVHWQTRFRPGDGICTVAYFPPHGGEASRRLQRTQFQLSEIAYIGDDVNDLAVLEAAGISACPADAMDSIRDIVDYVCENKGGYGAFREFAEWLIKGRS